MPLQSQQCSDGRVRRECAVAIPLAIGSRGKSVSLVQEWLSLSGQHVAIDGIFGPATAEAVKRFQARRGLAASGTVDQSTLDQLVEPVLNAAAPLARRPGSLGSAIVDYAHQHLRQHPREIGGANKGPWVRFYMGGNEGRDWLWCAGFVSYIVGQATAATGARRPLVRSYSCDVLAVDARQNGRLLRRAVAGRAVKPGYVFVRPRTASDWDHTGVVVDVADDLVETIEGNTNDDGSRDGYEVCTRTRAASALDFIATW